MKKVSTLTAEELGYYVYTLIDPRTDEVFYVGKGKGSRVYAHVLSAESVDSKDVAKIKRINAIKKAGFEVRHEIIRHKLSQDEAFLVESVLIDFIGGDNLTNLVSGHNANQPGRTTIEELEIQYKAPKADIQHSMVLFRINQAFTYQMSAEELYRVTRKHWKMSSRAKKYRYACAVYLGVIRKVYEVQSWYESREVEGRWEFKGKVALDVIRNRYRHTTVAHLLNKGSQNPFKYIDVKEVDSNKVFMDALTASDEAHRKAMRGMTLEIATSILKDFYKLTDKQARKAQHLRDVEGLSEDDAIAAVTKKKRVNRRMLSKM